MMSCVSHVVYVPVTHVYVSDAVHDCYDVAMIGCDVLHLFVFSMFYDVGLRLGCILCVWYVFLIIHCFL